MCALSADCGRWQLATMEQVLPALQRLQYLRSLTITRNPVAQLKTASDTVPFRITYSASNMRLPSRVRQARAAILRALPTLEMFDGKPVKSTEAAAASQVPAVKRVDRAREQPQRSLAAL